MADGRDDSFGHGWNHEFNPSDIPEGVKDSPLLKEVADKGYASCLTNADGVPLASVVGSKLRHSEHESLGKPLKFEEMLALVLYTGCDCYKDLRKYQYEHAGRNIYRREPSEWCCFDRALDSAVRKLGAAQLAKYGPSRGLPSKYAYHGTNWCKVSVRGRWMLPNREYTEPVGELPTFTSFSTSRDVALFFSKGKGSIARVDMTLARDSDLFCDVTWISKFPQEQEVLFHRNSYFEVVEETRKMSQDGIEEVELRWARHDWMDQ